MWFVFHFILTIIKEGSIMKCSVCNSQEFYVKKHDHEYSIKGKKITFSADRKFCSKCNNLVYDEEFDNIVSMIAIKVYNELYGIKSAEIVNLRKSFGLSQELFSKVLGCAKKTLISYEKGTSIPNDSYAIIINSLLANPETIFTIINANRSQFTDKEFERLCEKLQSKFSDSVKLPYSKLLSEFNGYTEFSLEKMYNMILFFSQECILKTKLLKEMFYADFLFYKSNCKSITGLEYVKLPFGPVPDQFESILNVGISEDIINYDFEIQNDYEYHTISPKQEFNEKCFTKEELEILNRVKSRFESFGSKDIVEFSHNEKAFLNTEFLKKISYDYAFDIE